MQKLVGRPAVYLVEPGKHTLEFSNVFEAREVRTSGGGTTGGGVTESFESRQEGTYRNETQQPFRVEIDARPWDQYNVESGFVGSTCLLTVSKGREVVGKGELK